MKNDNDKRTQRTPEQIIAETEAKLERLRLKQAKEVAQSDPEVKALNDERAKYQKEIRDAKKTLGNGPQSAQARKAKHEAWIRRINNDEVAAHRTLEVAEDEIAQIDAKIAAKVSQLSA
jgi:chromosome segregation ATPase